MHNKPDDPVQSKQSARFRSFFYPYTKPAEQSPSYRSPHRDTPGMRAKPVASTSAADRGISADSLRSPVSTTSRQSPSDAQPSRPAQKASRSPYQHNSQRVGTAPIQSRHDRHDLSGPSPPSTSIKNGVHSGDELELLSDGAGNTSPGSANRSLKRKRTRFVDNHTTPPTQRPSSPSESLDRDRYASQQPVSLSQQNPGPSSSTEDSLPALRKHSVSEQTKSTAEPGLHQEEAAPPSSLLSLLSQTPTVSTPTNDGSDSRARRIRSSQSDEDLDEDTVLEKEGAPEVLGGRTSSIEQAAEDMSPNASDSESSLESISTLARRRKPDTNSPKPVHGKSSRSAQRIARSGVTAEELLRRFQPKATSTPRYKFSLDRLADQEQRNARAREEIDLTDALLEDEEPSMKSGDPVEPGHQSLTLHIDEEVLNHVVKDEEGEGRVDRLKQAMDRTDLLNGDIMWDFFDYASSQKPRTCQSFPIAAVGPQGKVCRNKETREHAFLTGFLGDCWSDSTLPVELESWLWDAITTEPRDDLSQAYMHCLVAGGRHGSKNSPSDRLINAIHSLHARPEALGLSEQLMPTLATKDSTSRKVPSQLRRILRLISYMTKGIAPEGLKSIAITLLRLGTDQAVSASISVDLELRKALHSVVESFVSEDAEQALYDVGTNVISTVGNRVLQYRLVSSIPDSLPRLALFKRRLALAFFLDSPNCLFNPLSISKHLTAEIARRLTKSQPFDLTDAKCDYRRLHALTCLLDIAVGGGFIASATLRHDAPDRKAVEIAFNSDVDTLTSIIHNLSTRIMDTGASHMLRTDAKQALRNLACRLEYGVRTRPKPRKSFVDSVFDSTSSRSARKIGRKVSFGGEILQSAMEEKQAKMMKGFLQPMVSKRPTAEDI